ncbi:MAG: divergent PAP2 family protein [Negativicutes bacterium]|nr:divergent PAP2 family protein [Negativicutes bacterium]
MNVWHQLLTNRYIVAAFIGSILAQVLKVFVYFLLDHRWNWRLASKSGGMPSSHTAAVVALTTTIGRYQGVDSVLFAVSTVFSIVVMYDASGVRRAAGDQAKLLNSIIYTIPDLQDLQIKQLKEILGHTPIEVLAGGILGIIIGFLV